MVLACARAVGEDDCHESRSLSGLPCRINIYTFMYVDAALLLRLLGDPTRLRLLRVLSAESLNVSELTAVLGVAQSGVSRHLGLLRDAGLVTEARSGGFSWYRLAEGFGDGSTPSLEGWL